MQLVPRSLGSHAVSLRGRSGRFLVNFGHFSTFLSDLWAVWPLGSTSVGGTAAKCLIYNVNIIIEGSRLRALIVGGSAQFWAIFGHFSPSGVTLCIQYRNKSGGGSELSHFPSTDH